MELFQESTVPSSSDHLANGEYHKGNEAYKSKGESEGEFLNIEMTPDEATEVYKAKGQLKMKAEENIDGIMSKCDHECSADDLASREEVKYLKAIMPGMIYQAVFKDMDNEAIRTHVMGNVLAEVRIEDDIKEYVYNKLDKKAVDLLREFADAQTLQELVDLKNALSGKDAYLVGGNQDEGGAETSTKEIERMKKEIAMLRAKTEGIDEGRPAGMSN